MTEVAQVGEETNRPRGAPAGLALDEVAHRDIERLERVPQVIPPVESSHCRSTRRPEPTLPEHRVELGEVEVHQEKGIAECVLGRFEPAVPDTTGVDRAGESHSVTPNFRVASSALTTPSSWKPLRQ
jgi:hypothetical protein